MIQPTATPQNPNRLSASKTAQSARKAAEALFQSSENQAPAHPRRGAPRLARAQVNIVSIRRYVVGRLLGQVRYSRRLEFVELPRVPGKPVSGEARSPVFLMIFGPEGRTLYLALEDDATKAAVMPPWWDRLSNMGHRQRRVRAKTAVDAWRMVHLCLKNAQLIEG